MVGLPIPANKGITDYSTSEVATGQRWIDGKMIYKKTFSFTLNSIASGSTSSWTGYNTDIFNTDTIIKVEGTIDFVTNDKHYSRTPYAKSDKGWEVFANRDRQINEYPLTIQVYHYDSIYNGGTVTATVFFTKL